METEGSLLSSQELATGSCPKCSPPAVIIVNNGEMDHNCFYRVLPYTSHHIIMFSIIYVGFTLFTGHEGP
jgi:hypothetical protein